VQDSSGAVVPGATITLSAVDTGATQTSTTDSGGNYLFAQLKPGRYSVAVSKEGFQTRTISQVELLVGQRPRVDITLAVGAVAQSVEVSAGGVQLLETQTSTMGQVIQEKPVQELPLNGRNFMQLAVLSPGVAPVGTGVSPATGWVGQSNVTTSVAGLRESNESFLVDGIESRNARFGSVGLRPSPEAIQEFKMQTSDFSAEFGTLLGHHQYHPAVRQQYAAWQRLRVHPEQLARCQ
jgi:Carboxypeptidase regulatory-like domain